MTPMEMAPAGAGNKAAAAAPASRMPMMHMSFFWGNRAVVLFPGWPGARGAGAYLLCLLLVLALAALTEALAAASRCVARRGAGAGAGRVPASSAALLTAAHAARMGTAYLVMLAVMSFNGGVLLAAVAGHALGFLIARSRVHNRGGSAAAAAARDRELGGMDVHPPDVSKA
jgi:solute carrier family 31 (copper transporter), member 1